MLRSAPEPDDLYSAAENSGRTERIEWIELERLLAGADFIAGILVRSASMKALAASLARLAMAKSPVLIQGESGTGKELVARALHCLGPAAGGPFIPLNCSNLVDSLADAQLFGHVRGAFTDAREEGEGYFRAAEGGTLFLDEVGELPLRLQPKLLRAVETLEIQPVGSSRSHKANVRLVGATNRDLRAMVARNEFRPDLYYRLNAITIEVPPLRDRRDAIGAMLAYFVRRSTAASGKEIRFVSSAALDVLEGYDWPGNVRELGHLTERAVLDCDSDRLDVANFPAGLRIAGPLGGARSADAAAPPSRGGLPSSDAVWSVNSHTADSVNSLLSANIGSSIAMDDVIRTTLLRALARTSGNRSQTARLLGISRSRVYRLLEIYGLASVSPASWRGRATVVNLASRASG
ncbi:MAG TPA: sigma-54 dependent transcriptional regulator [Candidatus Binataceae bacterium]|nr:sigma-54 dependent transcriptional regulator [Candidatus Binataceae bacterium]